MVFSGGQDSTTCLYWAKSEFDKVCAVTFSYGQKHIIELDSAKKIAEMANVDHEFIDLGELWSGLSSLTDASKDVPTESLDSTTSNLPSTFVPGRNILFLSIAASRAYTNDASSIVIGVSQEDFAGYPDCRSSFISSMQEAVSNGLDQELTIHSPLMHLSKKETVELAMTLPGCMDALAYSTTCYNGAVPPCMNCNSCQLRAKGFGESNIVDPLIARVEKLSKAVLNKKLGGSLC